jgi:hypothetical protein
MSKKIPDSQHNKSLKNLSVVIDGIRYVEKWAPIKRYKTRYHISTFGRIKSLKRKVKRRSGTYHVQKAIIKKNRLNNSGYETVYLAVKKNYRHYMVHVLVAEHFLKKRPSKRHQVNHMDGSKRNNHLSNLEWVTASQNLSHALRTGLKDQNGERHPSAKLNNKKVMAIFKSTESGSELAKKYRISSSMVSCIRSGKNWTHITSKIYEKKKPSNV